MDKLEAYKKYGYKMSEENLATLPPTAPQAAKDLARYLTLEGRRRSLVEWLGHVQEDSRIHGKFWNIGAWTHRMAHTEPNQGNIASAFTRTPETAVEEVKAKYNYAMRDLWQATPGKVLVGTDAEGIQLRVLTHYMKSVAWRDAICSGIKEEGTDVHTMNMKALGPVCKDRDSAKTFVYGWLLGASIPKIAEILSCSIGQAKVANDGFLSAFPELKKIKQIKIPNDAARGYFIGLDGRKVICNSEHLMLAGYLQNGESTIMKHATVNWMQKLTSRGIPFKLVDLVHDEWQTEADNKTDAEEIGKAQCLALEEVGKELELFCPLAGKYDVGLTWSQTH